jgi:F-type H+-transporting ATPase subunit epsilon
MFIEIVSPEKTIYTGDVSSVFLPGTEGFFQVLDNHAPIVSTLKKGTIELKGEFNSDLSQNLNLKNGSSKASLDIESGVVEMRNNKLIILVD